MPLRCALLIALLLVPAPRALERKDVTFKIFQFPADQIPRVDGKTDDWAMVPESYVVGMNELMDTEQGHGRNHDTKNLDVRVKVGWVKGLNRVYFLYEVRQLLGLRRLRPSQRHLRSRRRRRSLRRTAHRHLPSRRLDARSGRTALGARPERVARRTRISAITASTRRTITSSRRRATRIGRWRGAASRGSRTSLRECRLRLQLQTGRVRKAGAGILDHAIRLCRAATARSARSNRS